MTKTAIFSIGKAEHLTDEELPGHGTNPGAAKS